MKNWLEYKGKGRGLSEPFSGSLISLRHCSSIKVGMTWLRTGQLAVTYDSGDEPSGSTECEEFLGQQRND